MLRKPVLLIEIIKVYKYYHLQDDESAFIVTLSWEFRAINSSSEILLF